MNKIAKIRREQETALLFSSICMRETCLLFGTPFFGRWLAMVLAWPLGQRKVSLTHASLAPCCLLFALSSCFSSLVFTFAPRETKLRSMIERKRGDRPPLFA